MRESHGYESSKLKWDEKLEFRRFGLENVIFQRFFLCCFSLYIFKVFFSPPLPLLLVILVWCKMIPKSLMNITANYFRRKKSENEQNESVFWRRAHKTSENMILENYFNFQLAFVLPTHEFNGISIKNTNSNLTSECEATMWKRKKNFQLGHSF